MAFEKWQQKKTGGRSQLTVISQQMIPIHENLDTDVNPESFAASKFFNCELRIGMI